MTRMRRLSWSVAILVCGATSSASANMAPLSLERMGSTRGGLAVDRFDVPAAAQTRSKFDNVQTSGAVREALTPDTINLAIFAGEGKVGAQTVTSRVVANVQGRVANFSLRTGNATEFPFSG